MYDLTNFKVDGPSPQRSRELSIYHRLIGNGGFPQRPSHPSSRGTLRAWDNRVYKTFDLNGGRTESYVFNGYMTIVLDGPSAAVEYRTFACADTGGSETCSPSEGPSFTTSTLLASETFEVSASTGRVSLVAQDIDDTLMTVLNKGEGRGDDELQSNYRQRYASLGGDHEKAALKRDGEKAKAES